MAMGQASRQKIVTAISGRTKFTVNSMSGNRVNFAVSTGQMPETERAKFLASEPEYVIWSYGTPIGWVGKRGRKYITGTSYSVTTSAHLGIVKQAFGTYETA